MPEYNDELDEPECDYAGEEDIPTKYGDNIKCLHPEVPKGSLCEDLFSKNKCPFQIERESVANSEGN